MPEVITEREIKVMEFDQIRKRLASMTVSPMAKEEAEKLLPSADYATVKLKQQESGEGRLLCSKRAFNPSRVEDIKPFLSRALKGSMLSGAEFAAVLNFHKAVLRWNKFFKNRDHCELYPLMAEISMDIYTCQDLLKALEQTIDPEGVILDSASSTLASVRKKKLSYQDKIREKLDHYIRSANYRRYLQDALITIRSGRYVLPVKQEYRQHLEGVIHDQSSSGATVFIEPLPVVEMQNALTSLHRQEEAEIERILIQLSSKVAGAERELFYNRALYTRLDSIVARGRLSIEMSGSEPLLLEQQETEFKLDQAFHPLLQGEKVPLEVSLGGEVKTLVVTGPNTGGKTVALKTIGLLAIMIQSGLQVPVGRDTRLTVFKIIRADIGDEQSIAQSLSTFSGHMRNIITMVEEAGSGSLVLFDELGAGTDPTEGAALAMAILEELTHNCALTVATTHINELKLFAQTRDYMQNAAMEFDLDTLAPTYRLMQGIPGQSNAFHVAGQLGLPGRVLDKAKSYMHRSHEQVESIIASLVEDQQRFSRDSRQAELEKNKAESLLAEIEKERVLLRARREDILKQARDEARQILKDTKHSADQLIKELQEIKQAGTEKSQTRAEQIRSEINKMRRDTEQETSECEVEGPALSKDEIAAGQAVYIRSLKQQGEVLSFTRDEATVQVGSIKVNLPISELLKMQDKDKAERQKEVDQGHKFAPGNYSVQKEPVLGNSIDLRGLTLDEAIPLVEKHLDNSYWAGLGQVDLIHGKGTGKLKQGLQEYLKGHKQVRQFRTGYPGEGGEGITVVELAL